MQETDLLTTTASVAAALLGIALAVVTIVPAAYAISTGATRGWIHAMLRQRRLRRYFLALGGSIPIFGTSTLIALAGLAFDCGRLARPAAAVCAVGIVVVVIAACALFVELLGLTEA